MLRLGSRLAAMGIIVAFSSAALPVCADTVFGVSGQFSVVAGNPGGDAISTSPGTAADGFTQLPVGTLEAGGMTDLTLSYQAPAASISLSSLPSTVSIGRFILSSNVSAPSSPLGFDSGDRFALTITQSSPVGAPQVSNATIDGTISFDSSGGGSNVGVLTLHFDPNPLAIAGSDGNTYNYALQDTSITVGTTAPDSALGTLKATVSIAQTPSPGGAATPLPTTASTGLVLLGILGGAAGLRRWLGRHATTA